MDLYDKLIDYKNSGYYPMHMPGHKRNEAFVMENPYAYDITEIDGFDNLHEANGILKESMDLAASIFHSKKTYYLVNGSTAGLLTGISACTNRGDRILMARNSHKAVYNSVYLRELKPVYLYPHIEHEFGILCGINSKIVEEMLITYPDIKLVVITSPTYEGVVSDIAGIANIAHKYHVPLLVDEAHGAHFGFHKAFPQSALSKGADIVIQSIHKTLPALTQTALLHINSDMVCEEEIKRYYSIYQSSSPSYVLMSGIDNCMQFLKKEGTPAFERYANYLSLFYEEIIRLTHIRVWIPDNDILKDPSKIIIGTIDNMLTGQELSELLLNQYKIQAEMVSKDYLLCMTSICDTKEGFERLMVALKGIDKMLENKYVHRSKNEITYEIIKPDCYCTHYEATRMESELIALNESKDKVAAEYVYLYPPGIPILVPGEVISRKMIDQLQAYKKAGLALYGMQDKNAEHIKILR